MQRKVLGPAKNVINFFDWCNILIDILIQFYEYVIFDENLIEWFDKELSLFKKYFKKIRYCINLVTCSILFVYLIYDFELICFDNIYWYNLLSFYQYHSGDWTNSEHFWKIKMRIVLLFVFVLVLYISTTVNSAFLNPYPPIVSFSDNGDPGEALYLTKYIYNGDYQTVRFVFEETNISKIFRKKNIKIFNVHFRHSIYNWNRLSDWELDQHILSIEIEKKIKWIFLCQELFYFIIINITFSIFWVPFWGFENHLTFRLHW